MVIPMTIAASGTVDNEWPHAHSPLMPPEEITHATTHLFLQQWSTFHQELANANSLLIVLS